MNLWTAFKLLFFQWQTIEHRRGFSFVSNQLPFLSTKSSIEERIVYLLADKDKKVISLIFDHYGALLLNSIKMVFYKGLELILLMQVTLQIQ